MEHKEQFEYVNRINEMMKDLDDATKSLILGKAYSLIRYKIRGIDEKKKYKALQTL